MKKSANNIIVPPPQAVMNDYDYERCLELINVLIKLRVCKNNATLPFIDKQVLYIVHNL